jgi:hypothetical protein
MKRQVGQRRQERDRGDKRETRDRIKRKKILHKKGSTFFYDIFVHYSCSSNTTSSVSDTILAG